MLDRITSAMFHTYRGGAASISSNGCWMCQGRACLDGRFWVLVRPDDLWTSDDTFPTLPACYRAFLRHAYIPTYRRIPAWLLTAHTIILFPRNAAPHRAMHTYHPTHTAYYAPAPRHRHA